MYYDIKIELIKLIKIFNNLIYLSIIFSFY